MRSDVWRLARPEAVRHYRQDERRHRVEVKSAKQAKRCRGPRQAACGLSSRGRTPTRCQRQGGWRWWAFTPQCHNGLKRHRADEQLTRWVARARRPVRNWGLNHFVLLAVQVDRRRTGLISTPQGRIQSIWSNGRGEGAARWRTSTVSRGGPAPNGAKAITDLSGIGPTSN